MTAGNVEPILFFFQGWSQSLQGSKVERGSRLSGITEFRQVLSHSQGERPSSSSQKAKPVQGFELLPEHKS